METVNTLWILLDALILLTFLDPTTNACGADRSGRDLQGSADIVDERHF